MEMGQKYLIFFTLPLLEEATHFNYVAVDKYSNFPRAKINISNMKMDMIQK